VLLIQQPGAAELNPINPEMAMAIRAKAG